MLLLQARQKQIARLTREERLAALQIELSNKKTVRLGQLRKFARPVSPLHPPAWRQHLGLDVDRYPANLCRIQKLPLSD